MTLDYSATCQTNHSGKAVTKPLAPTRLAVARVNCCTTTATRILQHPLIIIKSGTNVSSHHKVFPTCLGSSLSSPPSLAQRSSTASQSRSGQISSLHRYGRPCPVKIALPDCDWLELEGGHDVGFGSEGSSAAGERAPQTRWEA